MAKEEKKKQMRKKKNDHNKIKEREKFLCPS